MEDFSTPQEQLVPVIGLTGGIGSGKSTAARIFHSIGIPVFHADDAAKGCYKKHAALRQWVVETFGSACGRFENGELVDVERSALASAVFGNQAALDALNAHVHPLVQSEFREWHTRQSMRPSVSYVIREAAILFESGTHEDCARIISVEADEDLRATRAAARMGVSTESVRHRIQRQWSDEQRAERSDFILRNNRDEELLEQVLHVDDQLRRAFSHR